MTLQSCGFRESWTARPSLSVRPQASPVMGP